MISASTIFLLVFNVLGLQDMAIHYREALATATSDIHSNMITNSNSNNTIQKNNVLVTKILAKNLDHLKKAGTILEITSKLPQEMYLMLIYSIKH
jgi:hypothetical protein